MFGRKRALLAISPALTTEVTCYTLFPPFWSAAQALLADRNNSLQTVFSEGNIVLVLLSPCNDINFVKWLYQISRQVCSGPQEKWCTYYIHLWCYQQLLTWLYLPAHTLAVQKTNLFFQPLHVHASQPIYSTLLVPTMFLAHCHTCKIRPRFPLAGGHKHPKLPFAILGCCFYLFQRSSSVQYLHGSGRIMRQTCK